jgi:hypothetical protein
MEHQQWEPTVLRKSDVTSPTIRPAAAAAKKLDGDDVTPVKKVIQQESIQELVAKRAERKLTQKQADTACAFPPNTFRDIEAKHYIPTEKQQNVIQRVLGVQLKIVKV